MATFNHPTTHNLPNDAVHMQKMIKDCIYGHIAIPSLCLSFIDVPEFQRLRRVRQLGMAHYAYPSAVHTRFEHSLGVMHLAGKMVDQLRNYVEISQRVKELIQLSGMYHDIGHFSYSHLFDSFLSDTGGNDLPYIFTLHHHEDRSIFFLRKINSRLKLLNNDEENFVSDIIKGNIPKNQPSFLYQIICNKECGIDVDRMDYLHRDSFWTGFPGFQADYIVLCATIDKEQHLAFKQKAYHDIQDLYKTRRRMYRHVYHHHTTLKIDKMHRCMLQRLGHILFMYGESTDDYNIETLLRNSPETSDLMLSLDNRQLEHDCDICHLYNTNISYTSSGKIDDVRFL
jgi:HD superfamily phosphohydrolase